MSRPAPKLDSLDTVELLMMLEESGLLTGAQLDRLAPYLIAPLQANCIRGGIESAGTVIAQASSLVLFVENGRKTLGVGVLAELRTVREYERYASAEMAVRAFLRKADEQHDI